MLEATVAVDICCPGEEAAAAINPFGHCFCRFRLDLTFCPEHKVRYLPYCPNPCYRCTYPSFKGMSQTCYTTHGIILPDYGPCDTKTTDTFCCTAGQTCLSNGLCATEIGTFYSGGCTDKTYKAAICPSFCTTGTPLRPYHPPLLLPLTQAPGSSNFLVECTGAAVKDGDFCCSSDGGNACCSNARNGLGLVAAKSSTRAAIAKASGSATTGSSSLGSSTSSSGASSQTTTSSLESVSLHSTSSLSSLQSMTTSKSANTPSNTNTSTASDGIQPEDRLIIGLTVGLGVPVVLLCLLLGFMAFRHFHKRNGLRPKQTAHTELDADGDKAATSELAVYESPKELASQHAGASEAHEIDSLTRSQRKWPERGEAGMVAVEMDTDTEIPASKSDATPRTSLVPDENPLHPSPATGEKST